MKSVLSCIERAFCKLYQRNIYPSDEEVLKLFTEEKKRKNYERLKDKNVIKVGFTFMSVALWKYETVFQRMLQDKRFDPSIIIAPRHDKWQIRKKEIKDIERYCKERNYPFIPLKNNFFNVGRNLAHLHLDVLFYTQPYSNLVCKEYYYDKAYKSLLAYMPYDNLLSKEDYSYNSILHKIAWKLFYPFSENSVVSERYGINSQKIVITRPMSFDIYLNTSGLDWKTDKKKIIWAPHSSILKQDWLHLSCFLEVYDYMLELAKKYYDQIEIAFKPHPHLYANLVQVWGEEKAKKYYDTWRELGNGFLYEEQALPLLKTSDAMIHDCGAFVMDYMMTGKPCLYLLLNGEFSVDIIQPAREALDAHYQARNMDEIEDFMRMIIDGTEDIKQSERLRVQDKWIKSETTATEILLSNIK